VTYPVFGGVQYACTYSPQERRTLGICALLLRKPATTRAYFRCRTLHAAVPFVYERILATYHVRTPTTYMPLLENRVRVRGMHAPCIVSVPGTLATRVEVCPTANSVAAYIQLYVVLN
jgi:hypothetical protein